MLEVFKEKNLYYENRYFVFHLKVIYKIFVFFGIY